MLGIRPDWLRMHRKARRPAMGAFRAATMHQYFSATNFLPVSDAMSSIVSSCVPRGDLTAPCWVGHAAIALHSIGRSKNRFLRVPGFASLACCWRRCARAAHDRGAVVSKQLRDGAVLRRLLEIPAPRRTRGASILC